MTLPTRRRPVVRSVAIAALAAVASACPGDPPSGPAGPTGPTAATVTEILPGGPLFNGRPMSADGRFVAYATYNPETNFPDPYVWDRSTGTSVRLAEPTPSGPSSLAPVVSTDGSTVYYAAAQLQPEPFPSNDARALVRYDTASGDVDAFLVPDNAPFNSQFVTDVATSGDGTLAAVELRPGPGVVNGDIALWTEAGGFEPLTESGAVGSELVLGHDLPGAAVSENGRYVAVTATIAHGSWPWPSRHTRLDVYDRTTDTVQTAWTGATTTDLTGSEVVTVLSTLDDGSVIFDVTTAAAFDQDPQSQGVRRFDAGTATLSQLVVGDSAARGWSASADGRFIGYTGSDLVGPPSAISFGTPHLLDLQTGAVLPAGTRPITLPVAIGSGADDVLLFSGDPQLDPTPAGLFLWDRT